jgi:Condensation domain
VIENVPTRAATPDTDTLTYPVSYAQESLLRGVHESAVNVPAVTRVGAGVTTGEVQQVLDALVARHDALRTVFGRTDGGAIVGRVRPAGTVPLRVVEHRHRPADLLPRVLLAGSEQPFALAGAPLARAELHRAGATGGLLVLWLHHAVSDLVSVQVLGAELARLLRGGTLTDPGLPMAEVARGERAVRATARQQDHWTRALAAADCWLGQPAPAGTPHQILRPALPRLPAGVVDGLGRLAADHRTTVTTVLAAAVLAAHAGEAAGDRCVLGLTVSNRDHPQLRGTVGCLADQLPLVVDLGGRPTFGELVGRVREALLDAYDARLPLGLLLPLLGRPAGPVFGVNLNFLPPPVRRRSDPQPEAAEPRLPYGITKRRAEPWWLGDAALAYRPRIDASGLAGEIEGDAHLHDPAEIRRRGERFCALLAAVSEDPYLDVRTLGTHPAAQ